jgi:hypothetical protein
MLYSGKIIVIQGTTEVIVTQNERKRVKYRFERSEAAKVAVSWFTNIVSYTNTNKHKNKTLKRMGAY